MDRSPYLAQKPPIGSTVDPSHWMLRGLLGWWILWEGTGGTAHDISGFQNHGTLINGPTWTPGRHGYALDLDGADDYVSAGDADIFSFGDSSTDFPFSVSAWVLMRDSTRFRMLGKMGDAEPNVEWQFSFDGDDKLRLVLFDEFISSEKRLDQISSEVYTSLENSWHFVAASYTGNADLSGIRLYIDGQQVDTSGTAGINYGAMHSTTAPVNMGRDPFGTPSFASGVIDDLRVYDRALSAAEWRQLYLDPWAPFRRFVPAIIPQDIDGQTIHTLASQYDVIRVQAGTEEWHKL